MNNPSSRCRAASVAAALGLLCVGATAQADVIFQENFANGLNGFLSAGPVTTGAFGVRMAGTFGGTDGAVRTPAISTANFNNIRLSFTRATTGLDAGETGIAQVSINGGAFTTVDSQQTINARTTLTLAAATANTSIQVRFAIDASNGQELYTVSNIVVEGDPVGNNPDPGPGPQPNPGGGSGGGGVGPVGCNNLAPGDFNCTIASAGGNRTYMVHVPASYNRANAVPLVIDMHGFTSSAAGQRGMSGWLAQSNARGFIAVWPQGQGNSWNAQGQCCGSATADDPAFIRDIAASVKLAANITINKVWATGLSNGGSMSHTMACGSAAVFSAVGPVSFTLSGGNGMAQIIANCRPSQPIAVFSFHGTADNLVNFNTGVLDAIGAPQTLASWVQIQQCNATPVMQRLTNNTNCQIHSGCGGAANQQVALCTVTGGAHVLYPNVPSPGIASFLYDFFQAQTPR
jgi:polyhydroxybutyrate depolymerase